MADLQGQRFLSIRLLLLAAQPSMMQIEIMGDDSVVVPNGSRVGGCVAAVLVIGTLVYGVRRLQAEDTPGSVATADTTQCGGTTSGGTTSDEDASDESTSGGIADIEQSCAPDQVEGRLIMLDENGGWSWFQDERAIHDAVGRRLVSASVGSFLGYDGARRDANIDATTFELETGRRTRVMLSVIPKGGPGDDHSAAAFWQRPDGRYLTMYTGHNWPGEDVPQDGAPESFYRITTHPHDGSRWGPEQTFTWPANDATEPIYNNVTYSNLLYLARESRLYNIARAADRAPNIMVSDDWGESWQYGGKLTVTGEVGQSGQYSNGYFKFSSNGVDRIDFIMTEHHPLNFNTSIYHGYVQGGRSYDGSGSLVDDDIFDEVAPEPAQFTPVWMTSEPTDASYHHAWTADLERDDEGGLRALFTTRHGTGIAGGQDGDCDHRLFYGRFDGAKWRTTEIAKMGGPLYCRQEDYTGLGAIHPNDPSRIYISTPIDPRDGSTTDQHEIYAGVTHDDGATWTWTAITMASTVDNLRPIVPSWDADHTAVLWLRGRYPSLSRYDLSVVGVIDRSSRESTDLITYVDADPSNTRPTDGSKLTTSAGTSRGRADDRWHLREAFGNDHDVLASNERGSEDAPLLVTTLEGLDAGTYDVFVFYWVAPGEDWRIQAGLSPSELLTFRRQASQIAVGKHFENSGDMAVCLWNVRMYQSYVGRVEVTDAGAIEVFVDDVGGGSPERTWYDGVGYARVLAPAP